MHMTTKGYNSLAAAGLEFLIYEKRGEEKEEEGKARQGSAKKPRLDPSQNRPSWVKGSASEVIRPEWTITLLWRQRVWRS